MLLLVSAPSSVLQHRRITVLAEPSQAGLAEPPVFLQYSQIRSFD